MGTVRGFLAIYSPEDHSWSSHPLPLLIATTEVGYRYRGPGTDFWPVLEQELDTSFGPIARQKLRDLFVISATKHRGVHPPNSPWACAFHLIAWPITHALLPVEFHRPFATTLANLHARVRELDDADLYKAVRFAAGNVSARFDTWLSDPAIVVMITRKLLGAGASELADEALRRIADDLSRDDVARRNVAIARRVQRIARTSQRKPPEKPNLPTVRGRLQLQRRNEQLTLEASFPQIDHALLGPMRRALRRRRYAPKLWGVSARVPSEQLLSGLPFALKLGVPPDEDAELLPGVSDIEIDEEQRELLRSLRLDFRPPVLFAVAVDGEVARDVQGLEISVHRKYWLLAPPDVAAKLETLPTLGEVGPFACVVLDPSVPAAAKSLQRLGFRMRYCLSVGFAGSPPLDRDTIIPRFAVGDTRLVASRRPNPDSTTVELEGEEVRLGDELVKVSIQEGEHVLTVSNQGESRGYRFRGVKQVAKRSTRACWIDLVAPELTVQALLGGSLSLRIDSYAPIEGLELTIELEAAGRIMGVSTTIGPLPQTIAGDAELWSNLLNEKSKQLVLQEANPTLHVRVGALAFGSWPLEQRVRSCWWKYSSTEFSLHNELGVLAFGGVTASRPLERPDSCVTNDGTETVLIAPLEVDRSTHGPSAEFTTLCVAPSRMSLSAPAARKPRLQRRRRAGQGSAGLEDLMEAYLRWALAESVTLTAEIRRRQVTALIDIWVSELCCGEVWARREAKLGVNISDPWQLLVRACETNGLGRDPYVELAPGDEVIVTRLAVAEIRRTRPELWTRVGPPCDLDAQDYEALDFACGRAYNELARLYAQRGQEDVASEIAEGDPGTADEEWNETLLGVKARAELHELAELLTPSDSAAKLLALDFTIMSRDDLKEEFSRWGHGAQRALAGGVPDEAVLESILTLWLAPEQAVSLDWRSALDTLIAERAVSRAARYMCLRSRNLISGSGM